MDSINWAKAQRGSVIQPSPQEIGSPNATPYSKSWLPQRQGMVVKEFLASLWDEGLKQRLQSTWLAQ